MMKEAKSTIEARLPPFAFCESVAAGSTGGWHIRKVGKSLDLRSNGGYTDTMGLCGHASKNWSVDIGAPMSEFYLRSACPDCVAAYQLGMDALHTVIDVLDIKDSGVMVCFAVGTLAFLVGDMVTRGRDQWIVKDVKNTHPGFTGQPCDRTVGVLLTPSGRLPRRSGPVATSLLELPARPRVGDVLARLAPTAG